MTTRILYKENSNNEIELQLYYYDHCLSYFFCYNTIWVCYRRACERAMVRFQLFSKFMRILVCSLDQFLTQKLINFKIAGPTPIFKFLVEICVSWIFEFDPLSSWSNHCHFGHVDFVQLFECLLCSLFNLKVSVINNQLTSHCSSLNCKQEQ